MLLYINNSASSPTDRGTARRQEEPDDQESFRFLFSGAGIANDRDDVSGLVVPNPFLAFARDLDQIIWNAGEGIALADVPEKFTQAHQMDRLVRSPLMKNRGSPTTLASKRQVKPAMEPLRVQEVGPDDGVCKKRGFPAARCRRTTSPPVRHRRMRQSAVEARSRSRQGGQSHRTGRSPSSGGAFGRKRWRHDSS